MPKRFPISSVSAVAAACCLIGVVPVASGQNALGEGHALDANLQPGTQRNTAVRDFRSLLRFNNAVVTGNAPYGRSFRGEVGYLASEDFRASLGSNDLFVPLRESAQSTLVGGGIRGTDILQYQFALATGAAPPEILAGPTAGVFSRSGARAPGTLISSALRAPSAFVVSQSLRPSLVGYSRDEQGRFEAITASPLTGVRSVGLRAQLAVGEGEQVGGLLSGLEPTPRGVRDVLSTSAALRRLDTRARTEVEDEAGAEAEPANPFSEALLQDAEGEEESGRRASLLDRLRRSLRGELREGEVDPLAMPELPKETPEEAEEPREQREEGDKEDLESRLWEQLGPSVEKLDPDLVRALRETRVSVERLSDSAVVHGEAYRLHMDAGQSLLEQGRYFDAEDRFMRALSAAPDDLMATVGRIHAQIGAGLYLSAAANLRRALAEHPEMVTAEYDASLLPPPDRTTIIVNNLREQLEGENGALGEDAALLLAYIGHHAGDTAAMREGLRKLDELTPKEDEAGRTLVALLRAAWEE